MSQEYYPISILARQLEAATGAEFHTILKTLRSPIYINDKILKSELGLLNTKIVKLLHSSDDFDVWKGCHTAVVICAYNPLVLCAHASQLVALIYSKLEQKVGYYHSTIATPQGKVLLETLVNSLSILMDLMRGKPTISREGLVPKLKSIIPPFVTLSQYEPKLCLPVIKTLLYKNTTTFKPYANQYRRILSELINKSYQHLDEETQSLICENFAYLHLIKLQASQSQDETESHHKTFADDTWRTGLLSILFQFKPIIELCGEVLDFTQDKELQKLIESLPHSLSNDKQVVEFLPGLKLDMNTPLTLWQIPTRLSLLVGLLKGFVSLPTPFAVRIPIGGIDAICEALLSMTKKYLPLKRELRRDAELNSVISDIFPQIQLSGVQLWTIMLRTYGNSYLSMSESILSSLELYIPLEPKSTAIDFPQCSKLKREFQDVFHLINLLLPQMGHQLSELDPINKLIDVALYLSEDKSLIDALFNKLISGTKGANNQATGSKKKNKKDSSTGALSDIYTHPEQFMVNNSISWYNEVNEFLITILNSLLLSTTQQTRIIKYTISKALEFQNEIGCIPEKFIDLLRAVVLHPGNERVSVLPIAVSILKDGNDEIFDLLCHPRLPMGIVHQVRSRAALEQEESDEEDAEIVTDNSNLQSQIASIITNDQTMQPIAVERKVTELSQVDETKIFQKRENEEGELIDQESKRPKLVQVESEVSEDIEIPVLRVDQEHQSNANEDEHEDEDAEDDSEFEIPLIDIGDDDDEE